MVYRSAPGGVYTLRPSEARSPSADTSTTSGAGPRASTAPEDTASAASSSARAAWSTPAAMAGMARWTSHSSAARVNAAAERWAASTARRMTLPRCCADSTSGRSRPSGAANARTATCTADKAATSRSVVRFSQASSSSPALRCGMPLRSGRPCCLAFRLASVASWAIAHNVRCDGSRPYRCRYSSAIRAHLGRDLRPAGGEGVHDLLGHPAHLEAVPIRAGHQHIAQAGQTRRQLPGGHRRHGQALLVQQGAVQRPPAAVRAVRPLGQVEHRVMDVKLRIPLPGGVLEKRRDNAPGRVAVLPRGGRVVPRPDVQRPLCSRQRRACCCLSASVMSRASRSSSPASAWRPPARAWRAATSSEACSTDTDLAALTVKSKYGTECWAFARSAARTSSRSPSVANGCAA